MLQPNTGADFFIFIRNFALAFSIYNEITPFSRREKTLFCGLPPPQSRAGGVVRISHIKNI